MENQDKQHTQVEEVVEEREYYDHLDLYISSPELMQGLR